MAIEAKQQELDKYRTLVLATLDYLTIIYTKHLGVGSSLSNRNHLKNLAEQHYKKGSIGILRRWFKDLTEMFLSEGGVEYSIYIQENTGYTFHVFERFYKRLEKILEKGKITTTNQYRDVEEYFTNTDEAMNIGFDKHEQLKRILKHYINSHKKSL